MKIKSLLAALSIVGLASAATAGPLTYNVSRTIGPTNAGSLSGTITTNGLYDGFVVITGWSLVLDDGMSTTPTYTNLNSSFALVGLGLTADADSLDFDFSAANTTFLFTELANPLDTFWCGDGISQTQVCLAAPGGSESVNAGNNTQTSIRQGVVAIATRSVTAPPTGNSVPEPTSLALVGLALAGVAAARRRA